MSNTLKQDSGAAARQALVRWKRGHHAFHIQLVAMNTVIDDCDEALIAGDEVKAAELFSTLITLYDAATATMRYAADFPSEMYEKVVRPSMMPPFLSPGFSGLFNTEHALMLEGLRRLSRTLTTRLGKKEQWPDSIADAWGELGQAKARNRDSHALICQKFVQGGVSLLREFYALKRNVPPH